MECKKTHFPWLMGGGVKSQDLFILLDQTSYHNVPRVTNLWVLAWKDTESLRWRWQWKKGGKKEIVWLRRQQDQSFWAGLFL